MTAGGELLLDEVGIEVLVDGAATGDALREQGVIDLRNVLANDDLELAAGELATQNTLDLLDLLHVGLAVILERQTQARHAVARLRDVTGAANVLKDPRYHLFIYFCHCRLPVGQRSGVAQRLADIALIFRQQRPGFCGA